MILTLTPKNWSEFQHYKDRSPAWIKLHRSLLDNYDYACLPLASRALAPFLWLLASEYEAGEIRGTAAELAFRLRTSVEDLNAALKPLIEKGFFTLASGALADCKHVSSPEREKEEEIEEQAEKRNTPAKVRVCEWPNDFRDQFWNAYPKRVDKKSTMRKLEAVYRSDSIAWETLILGANRYARQVLNTEQRFIKSPEVWLNKGCWEDETGPPIAPIAHPLTRKDQIRQGVDDVRQQLREYAAAAGGEDSGSAVGVLATPRGWRSQDCDREPDRVVDGISAVGGREGAERDQRPSGQVQVFPSKFRNQGSV